jgi:hypothetical protein
MDRLQRIAGKGNNPRFKAPPRSQKDNLALLATRAKILRPSAHLVRHCKRGKDVTASPSCCHEDADLTTSRRPVYRFQGPVIFQNCLILPVHPNSLTRKYPTPLTRVLRYVQEYPYGKKRHYE